MKGRRREVEHLVSALDRWAAIQPDVVAVGVVGSYAYDRPRMGSDVDLVVLSREPGRYGVWVGIDGPLAPARLIRRQRWGPVTEWRFRRPSGSHVEFNVAAPSWAHARPLDPGTARVISNGLRILRDPQGALADARAASRNPIMDAMLAPQQFIDSPTPIEPQLDVRCGCFGEQEEQSSRGHRHPSTLPWRA